MAKKKSNDNVAKINLGKVVPSPIPDSDIDLILAGETPVGNLNALNTHGLKYFFDNLQPSEDYLTKQQAIDLFCPVGAEIR